MKTTIALVLTTAALLFSSYRAAAQPEALVMPSNQMPPPNGMLVGTPNSQVVFGNGVVLSNILFHDFLPGFPPPPAGLSATHTFNSLVDFDISFDKGTNFSHVYASNICSLNLQNMSASGSGPQSYDTEMLQLDLSGGNLDGTLMIRESPTLRSPGQTQISPITGGFTVSSFFDIFTELSMDGGQTWLPAVQSMHLDLRVDPSRTAPTTEPAPLMPPPNDIYAATGPSISFPNGLVLRDMSFKYFSQSINPLSLPLGTGVSNAAFSATLDCQLSNDGGQTYHPARIPAQMTMRLRKIDPGSPVAGGPHPTPWIIYDTEMLQLDLSGGDLPLGVMVRESPTLPSYGETGIIPMPDGTYQISSFFDIFTEASNDGGQVWQAQISAPGHLEMQRSGFQYQYTSPNEPPTNASYIAQSQNPIRFNNVGVIISNLTLVNFGTSFPPPPSGPPVEAFACVANFMYSLNNGQTFSAGSAPANAVVSVIGGPSFGPAQFYNTELLQLDISGGNLPPLIRIRESPTKASLGRMCIMQIQPGSLNSRIDSFFDIFTELSMDGGASFSIQNSSAATVALFPINPPIARLGVICPSDITVYTGDPSGAYVTYSIPPQVFPDCPFGPFTVTCVPPSGSKFPVGITTVTCTRTDGCGESATCTFKVTVNQSFIYYAGLAHTPIGSALLSVINTSAPQPSLVLSNLGSGGNDGFHLNLGAAEAIYFQYAPFNTANPPIQNTCIIHQATGPYALDPNHVLGIGTFFGGSNAMIRADFASIGATQILTQVMDESNHLIKAMLIPNASWIDLNTIFPAPCSNYNKTAYTYSQGTDSICYRFCMYGCTCVGTNCWIERVVCFRPDIALPAFPKYLSGIDLRAQGPQPPATLTILSEQIGKFGNLHQYNGAATSESQPGLLFADNIGPNGGDGLAIDLNNVSHFDVALAPTRFKAPGACWKIGAVGQFNGQINTPLGTATLTHSVGPGGGCDVAVDFGSTGADQARIDVYQGSQLVGTAFAPTGHLGTIIGSGNLIGCGKLGPPLPCFWMAFDSTFLFQSVSGPALAGDQIRLLAVNPIGPIQNLSKFSLQGCGLGQFVVVGETNPASIEVDTFPLPQAQITLGIPVAGGGIRSEVVYLTGTATMNVTIGPGGECADSNNNGLDEAAAQLVGLNLSGNSPSLGPIQVSLAPNPSLGLIEEQANNVPGILDIPPFTPTGTAKSFFDLFLIFQWPGPVGPVLLQNQQPFHLTSIITHKPPGEGDTFVDTSPPLDLYGIGSAQPSGYLLLGGSLVPNCVPPKISFSPAANGKLTLCWPALCGTGFQVQCATNLAGSILWQAVTNVVTNTNGQYCVTLDIAGGSRFYRVAR